MDGSRPSSPTPFTPPTTEEERLSWLRLIRSRKVGPATFARLLVEFGSADGALDALPAIGAKAGIPDYQPQSRDAALQELGAARRVGARLLCLGDPAYPPALAMMPDAPPVLWAMGRVSMARRSCVGMVGARAASSLGLRMARGLAEGAGRQGHVVVSGLARGIDAAVHGAALKTGTIAVMAGGVDVIYPAENEVLAAAIADQGLRLSEQPMGLRPQARHFPRRNRLIAGLAQALVVIEAAEGSGSLITARDALDLGRDVLAVPGHPADPRSAGANALIREGATLLRGVDDLVAALPPAPPPEPLKAAPHPGPAQDRAARAALPAKTGAPLRIVARTPAPAPQAATPPIDMLALHRTILEALAPTPVAEDQLLRDLGLPPAQVLPALLFLELDGRVERRDGGTLARR